MNSKELENLVDIGSLKREPANQVEFDGLLGLGRAKLRDSENKDLSAESRFDLAYGAAHAISLAAMRWAGYRPKNLRYAVFQSLPHTLSLGPEIWRPLDKAHALRNLADYAGSFRVDKQLQADLVKSTKIVLAAVEKLGPISEK
jgi:hypothetical protein